MLRNMQINPEKHPYLSNFLLQSVILVHERMWDGSRNLLSYFELHPTRYVSYFDILTRFLLVIVGTHIFNIEFRIGRSVPAADSSYC